MDQNQELPSAEMALALYAATAATMAARTLHNAGVLTGEEIEALIGTLTACRAASGVSPRIEAHIETLLDALLAPPGTKW